MGGMGLDVRDRFAAGRGYLGAATLGLPADVTVAALRRDVETYATGTVERDGVHRAGGERARGYAATLLGVVPSRVAVGSQASVFIGLAAAAAPPGAEVVCVEGDFASVVRPFLARGDLRVRQVPLAELSGAVGPDTWMVAYALVSSSTGEVADAAAVSAAATATGARVLVDVTQATGWLPTTDLEGRPRRLPHLQVALRTTRQRVRCLSPSERRRRSGRSPRVGTPAADPWASCYGPELDLAPRREPVRRLARVARLGRRRGCARGSRCRWTPADVHDHAVGLANGFRRRSD